MSNAIHGRYRPALRAAWLRFARGGGLAVLFVAALCGGCASQRNVRESAEYRAAMASYRQAHPVCEHAWNTNATHSARVAVHHRVPVSVNAALACDTNNMITLCDPERRRDGCHYVCGHAGDWRRCGNADRCERGTK